MKNVALLFTLIVFISCSTTTFQPFTSQKYAPTKKVDLYTNEKPLQEYIEIGRIIVGEDAFTGEMISDNYISGSYCLMIESYPTLVVASIEILLSDFLILAQKTT